MVKENKQHFEWMNHKEFNTKNIIKEWWIWIDNSDIQFVMCSEKLK